MTIHNMVVVCCDGPGVGDVKGCHTKETHMHQGTDKDVARAEAVNKGWAFFKGNAMCPLCYEIFNTVGA
jgi:hypothetical protein